MIINEHNLAWLLDESDPSIRYRTLTELVGVSEGDEEAISARDAIASSASVELLFSAMQAFWVPACL